MEHNYLTIDGLKLHYLEAGTGPPLLLLHGWPTSAQLWRDVIPTLAKSRRVLALDLPGFGDSDKPDASYSFRFYERLLDGFLAALGVEETGLAVHDLGGPIGLFWAVNRPERVTELAILNTLVFPETSWAVKAFVVAAMTPGLRNLLTSQWGVRKAISIGMNRRDRFSKSRADIYARVYSEPSARRALAKAGCGLHPTGLADLSAALDRLNVPTALIYGRHDRILPNVGKTMNRLKIQWPHATLSPLDAGHFLQEDVPDMVAVEMAKLLARTDGADKAA